ncbi:hypothetical protein NF867_04710, partial [Solitalea sp. MAHUQ-68]
MGIIYQIIKKAKQSSSLIITALLLFLANYSFGQVCPVTIKEPPTAKVTITPTAVCSGQPFDLVVNLTSDDQQTGSPEWTFTYTGGTGGTINTAALPLGVTITRTGTNAVVTIPITIVAPGNYTFGISVLEDNWYPTSPVVDACNFDGTDAITIDPTNTIALSSAAGTDAQTVCINTGLVNITYATTGATGATFSGLPAGVSGSWAADVATITGTPTVSGPFTYTINLTGGCGTVSTTG